VRPGRGRRRPHTPRGQRMPIVNGILLFVILIDLLQLWLFTATVHAELGGDRSIVLPAGIASAACLFLNVGLLWYLVRVER